MKGQRDDRHQDQDHGHRPDSDSDDMLPYQRLWQAYVNQMFFDITRNSRRNDDMMAEYEALKFFDRRGDWFRFVCWAAGYSERLVLRFYEQARRERADPMPEVRLRSAIRRRKEGGAGGDGRRGVSGPVMPFQVRITANCAFSPLTGLTTGVEC